jgi:hypothetical protein
MQPSRRMIFPDALLGTRGHSACKAPGLSSAGPCQSEPMLRGCATREVEVQCGLGCSVHCAARTYRYVLAGH